MVVMVTAVLVWWWGWGDSSAVSSDAIETEAISENIDQESSAPQKPSSSKTAEQTTQATEQPPVTSDAFTLEEAIGNLECYMRAGFGPAKGLAVVAMPKADGSRFAVLDGMGTVFDGELPFLPDFSQIGKRGDGSVVVGLAFSGREVSLGRLHEWEDAADAPMPVRVYLDGHIIFESVNVSDLHVATDGSSFFMIETFAGGNSIMRVHNLELGTEAYYDLDQIPSPYQGRYTTPQTEVQFVHEDISATQWFYPVDGGRPLSLKVDDDMAFEGVFASSRHGYFIRPGRSRFEQVISKREFRHDGTGESTSTELWSRTLDIDELKTMRLSEDGAWLTLDALNSHILNAATGETVFAFPTEVNLSRSLSPDVPRHEHGIYYRKEALKRLASILPAGATVDDVGMNFGSNIPWTTLIHGDLLIKDMHFASGVPVVDIYDMSEIQVDSLPKIRMRVDRYPAGRCVPGNLPHWGLQEVDGRLTYLTERLTFDSD